jgi:structure-specific endonuclease subunit SLX4 (BTB/POZ domain-containing protein 12)
MVNNPQLSDVQVQVDSGEVFSVHSFMLYARCPLLAQMVSYTAGHANIFV